MTPGPAGSAGLPRPCYLLPLRRSSDEGIGELTGYLREIAHICDVLIVDASPDPLFSRHHAAWMAFARHIRPDPALACRNGKVCGVVTGVRGSTAADVIIADDDVRYSHRALTEVLGLLAGADLVIPQNYFEPLPWHAAWDSGRILINRAAGYDYPGTLAVRRAAFLGAGCYDGDVLFENLELIRTIRAAGGRLAAAPWIHVRRLPPEVGHFAGQRVRQAYDSLAQPGRLAAELSVLPAVALALGRRSFWPLGLGAVAVAAAGEAGRRRNGGRAVFAWYLPLLAPVWLAERSVCSWLALSCRMRGGVRYAGQRLPRAATPAAVLRNKAIRRQDSRRRLPAGGAVTGAKTGAGMRSVAERLDG
ncbi:MAG TPA: glycosyltransferase family 2 protein [Streptosporangiaceae bacterium]|nr:glycosyltransferase family 2 protein [Streptosporangiaceae bacterium]